MGGEPTPLGTRRAHLRFPPSSHGPPVTIITAMRERTRFPASLIAQLPNLRLLTTPGMRNLAFDLPALADQSVLTLGCKGVPAGAEGRTGDATNEHCWGLILAATKGIVRDSDLIKSGAGRNGVPWQSGTNPTLRSVRRGSNKSAIHRSNTD